MKKVEVTWVDSSHAQRPGWYSNDDTCKPLTCRSVGYVHERTKKRLVLVRDRNDHQVAGLSAIPMVAVKKIRKLR